MTVRTFFRGRSDPPADLVRRINEHGHLLVEIDITDRDAPTIRSSDMAADDPLHKAEIRSTKSKMNMLLFCQAQKSKMLTHERKAPCKGGLTIPMFDGFDFFPKVCEILPITLARLFATVCGTGVPNGTGVPML